MIYSILLETSVIVGMVMTRTVPTCAVVAVWAGQGGAALLTVLCPSVIDQLT